MYGNVVSQTKYCILQLKLFSSRNTIKRTTIKHTHTQHIYITQTQKHTRQHSEWNNHKTHIDTNNYMSTETEEKFMNRTQLLLYIYSTCILSSHQISPWIISINTHTHTLTQAVLTPCACSTRHPFFFFQWTLFYLHFHFSQ